MRETEIITRCDRVLFKECKTTAAAGKITPTWGVGENGGEGGGTNNFKGTEHDSTHTAATERHKAESESLSMTPNET